MPKKFEKEFISYCENQNLEVNPNQIKVIKKLEVSKEESTTIVGATTFSVDNIKDHFVIKITKQKIPSWILRA